MFLNFLKLTLSLFLILSLSSCDATKQAKQSATAKIKPLGKDGISGVVWFKEIGKKVSMHVDVKSSKAGMHAIHIHEKGDCSAPDGSSAGGHWNPTKEAHGEWGIKPFHRGDIGNLMMDKNGHATMTLKTDLWCISCDDVTKNILNKSIIIHEKHDDFHSQPTGNAGGRYGCGVISKNNTASIKP